MSRDTDSGRGSSLQSTTDLAIMAWYMMHGIELVRVESGSGCKNAFVFDDPEDRTPMLLTQWANSQAHRFDSSMRTLRKVIAERRGRRGRGRKPRARTTG